MAEKKTTKKETGKKDSTKKTTKQTTKKSVDMTTPVTTADETGLELTEKMVQEDIVSDETTYKDEVIDASNMSTEELESLFKTMKDGDEVFVGTPTNELKGDEADVDLDQPLIDFQENKEIEVKQSVVEEEVCEKMITDHPEEEVCTTDAGNQEVELTPGQVFSEDKEMANDITNILNGLTGVKASKHIDEKPEKKTEDKSTPPKNTTNTEEKNYYSEQFSRSWGGVMYDY